MPLPPAPFQGSIYENQTTAQNKYFERRGIAPDEKGRGIAPEEEGREAAKV
jgi:hypothetical protein